MAQIAADALELPLERVKVFHGSTTYLPEGCRRLRLALDRDGRLARSCSPPMR